MAAIVASFEVLEGIRLSGGNGGFERQAGE
jgi:hypothetical protein